MSPEQVQDKETDARSDIFSFGAVLYEMATGRCAFAGESTATVIAEILRGEPKSANSEPGRFRTNCSASSARRSKKTRRQIPVSKRSDDRPPAAQASDERFLAAAGKIQPLPARFNWLRERSILDIGRCGHAASRVSGRHRECSRRPFQAPQFRANHFFCRTKRRAAGHGWNPALFSESRSSRGNVGEWWPDGPAASFDLRNENAGHFSGCIGNAGVET